MMHMFFILNGALQEKMGVSSIRTFLIIGIIAIHSINGLDYYIGEENIDPADLDLKNVSSVYLKNVTIHTLPKNYFKDLGSDALKIRIEDSNLEEIDEGAFDGLEHLNILDLIHNGIQNLNPETFSRLRGLEILNLESNDLTSIELNLPTVQELILSDNAIENLTADGLKGRNIRFLDLSFNNIMEIDSDFSHLELLETLDLSYNGINKIDVFAFNRNNKLAYLNLSSNVLSDTTGLRLKNLVSLDLSDNAFVSLKTTMFENMVNLERLFLRKNAIRILNDPFSALNNLEDLDLSENLIETIDSNLFENNFRLSKINLRHNAIKKLNPLTTELKSLFHFDISYNKISDIDRNFFESMSRLATLDLSGNQLKAVDGLFDPLKKLNKLYLASNNISVGGPFTSKNEALTFLNLSRNWVDLNASYFKTNGNLTHIDLSFNKITEFCAGDLKFKKLIDIDLRNNSIRVITCFRDGQFEKLEAVDIAGNPLICDADLDDTIHHLAVTVVSPSIFKDSGDDTMNIGPRPNETLTMWNKVKRVLCPEGFDINIGQTEDLKESLEDADNSESDASQSLEDDVVVSDEGLKPDGKEKEELRETTIAHQEELSSTPLTIKKIELNVQSQRNSWDALENDPYEKDIEIIDEDDIKRSSFTWYTVALILIGISLSLVCVNVAGFMYLRSRSSSNRGGGIKFAQTYTQLNNDVYRDTTEPMRTEPHINNNLYSPAGRTNKIFLNDQIQELLLNFGLYKKGEEDSESIKKMIVNTTSNSGLQQC